MSTYLTTPNPRITGMPSGIPYIIGNELAERFSFYGMKGILTIFMTDHLMDSSGNLATMSDDEAKTVYHLFTAAAYFFPIIGSLISDILWGKYRTILILSLGYCLGHAFLAMGDTGAGAGLLEPKSWLYLGLLFIAVGAGGIKPCVSAHVGDQFGTGNKHLISKVFSWFYFSINVGAMTSTLLTPVLLDRVGPWAAFGLPGILMAIATFVFWLGRNNFVHVPASGWEKFARETFSPDGRRAILNLAPIFLIFIPMFWAIFDQTGSAWVIQAKSMDREFLGIYWLESQVQAVNPFLILVLIPTFAYGLYPLVDKVWRMTPLRKIGIGLFLTAAAFTISAWIESRITGLAPQAAATLWTDMGVAGGEESMAGLRDVLEQINAETQEGGSLTKDEARQMTSAALVNMPSIGWQFLAYLVLTAAEVMVSITALEFAYTQAPKRMKSFIMGIYFLGVSLGNLFTSGVNFFIQNEDGTSKLEGADYYWFFTILMLITSVIFVFYAMRYKGQTFIQGEDLTDCPSCGYDLTGLKSDVCPECGTALPQTLPADDEASLVEPGLAGPHGDHGQDV